LWGYATDNGLEEPGYVVLPKIGKEKKDGKHKKSVNKPS